jgi:hypothetical protein
MGLFGQGRPIVMRLVRGGVLAIMAAVCACSCAALCAAELDVRLRFAWGSGGQSPQKWTGKITVAGATLSELQPLGIEADEAAALRLVGNEIRVTPLVRRAFDGCDVTVRGNEAAIIKVELQCSPDAPPKVIEAPLGQAAKEQFRATLDDLGGDLLIHRAPGDRLRVDFDRPHLVFNPAEELNLNVAADLKEDAGESPIILVATLRRVGDDKIIKQLQAPYDPATSAPIAFAFEAPNLEGAYRISLAAQRKTGLAGRLVPWEKNNVVASREVEFVVVDPESRLPRLTDAWETVATIDPTNSSWWQRAPQWTQLNKLPGFSTPRPLGNARPTPVPSSPLGLVQLPAEGPDSDSGAKPTAAEPAWQAYVLSVHRVGEPHAVEIEIPRGRRQHLGVSIVEPDAAGRVMSFGRDSGVYNDHLTSEVAESGVEVHRVVFWPRTKSPALLVTNRSASRAVHYGKIRLLHRVSEPAVADVSNIAGGEKERLVAAYIATPRLAETLGAAEELDPQSGVSVDGWTAFLTAANRLAQQLRAGGYNAAIVSIAAEGACLAPIDALGGSPRFDSGLLSASGADPVRKDVLEVLFRVFDREGLRLVPAVQLAAPLPALESLADKADIRHRNHDGQTWAQHFPTESAAAPHYNILHNEVQTELTAVVDQLVTRYGNHPSFAGLSIQLSGDGYGLLPGVAWGMDDATVARFASKHGLELPGEGRTPFRQRAALLLGKHLPQWKQWRQDELTSFYGLLAARVAADASERQLILATENLFSGPVAAERLRQAVGGRAL